MITDLPVTVELGGTEHKIRWDYKTILDICVALSDPEFSEEEKMYIALYIFYQDFESIPLENYREAIEKCMWFINCGEKDTEKKGPVLISWQQDFPLIAPPVNRVLGTEIRKHVDEADEDHKIHWFTFIGAYKEIGDCTLAQVVRIRDLRARGKRLDKSDREWYNRNRELVDLKSKYTQEDQTILKDFLGL